MTAETKKLVAGRELDALVAEARGLGVEGQSVVKWMPTVGDNPAAGNCERVLFRPDHYSTSISDAWELILESRNWSVEDQVAFHKLIGNFTYTELIVIYIEPEHICLAYLEVKGKHAS